LTPPGYEEPIVWVASSTSTGWSPELGGRSSRHPQPDKLIEQHKDDPLVRRAARGAATLEDVFIGLTGSEIRD